MTSIPSGKAVVRQTAAMVQSRPLVVALHPGYLEIRQQGKQTSYSLSYDAIFTEAARRHMLREKSEQQVMKQATKAGRS